MVDRRALIRRKGSHHKAFWLALLLIVPAGMMLGVLGGKAVDPTIKGDLEGIGGKGDPWREISLDRDIRAVPDPYSELAAGPSGYRPDLDYDAEVWPAALIYEREQVYSADQAEERFSSVASESSTGPGLPAENASQAPLRHQQPDSAMSPHSARPRPEPLPETARTAEPSSDEPVSAEAPLPAIW